jgi:hypothetical protein
MAVETRRSNDYLQRAPSPSGLADVIDVILDKGLVIDAFVRISLIGIELVTIDARIVIASVDTYLRFAEAVNRLDLTESKPPGLPELLGDRNGGGDEDEGGDGGDEQPSKLRGAATGAAAAAVAAGAVAAAKTLASRSGDDDSAEN